MASHFEKLEQTLSEIQLIYDEELSERERELGYLSPDKDPYTTGNHPFPYARQFESGN